MPDLKPSHQLCSIEGSKSLVLQPWAWAGAMRIKDCKVMWCCFRLHSRYNYVRMSMWSGYTATNPRSYCPWNTAVVPGTHLLSLEHSYCPWNTAVVPGTQLLTLEHSCCPWNIAVDPGTQLLSLEHSSCPWNTAVDPATQLLSLEHSCCSWNTHYYYSFHYM